MPFRNLTVIDIATLGAAPQIAAFFGDFGARVIKLEHPRGDALRQLVDEDGHALAWKLVNRNKQCATLDLSREIGRELLDRMLARADVLVCALGRERLQEWSLQPDQVAQRHPRLVSVNLTAYGTSGPWADRPGSGTLAEVVSGLAGLTGPTDAPPTLSPVGLGDFMAVLHGVIAALMGLYQRDAGGEGRGSAFDLAMFEPLLGLLSQRIALAVHRGSEPGRHGNRFPTMAPRNTYRTADGQWVAVTAGTDELVRRMFHLFGRPDLADDARFRSNRARLLHVDELDALISDWIGARSRDEVVTAFHDAGISLAASEGLLQVAVNRHFRARGALVDLIDEEIGPLTVAAPCPAGTSTIGQLRHLGRALGADNLAVYRDWLGLTDEELVGLRADGVI